MPTTISWFLQDRILIYRFIGIVTLEEVTETSQQGRAYRDSVPSQTIHTLYDTADLKEVPINLRAITKLAQTVLCRPNPGWIVTYNVNDCIVTMIANIVSRLLGIPYHAADTELQALDFLNAADPTLPPLRPLLGKSTDQDQAAD